MEREGIIIALAKGRIMKDCINLLAKSGLVTKAINERTRKLIFQIGKYTILSCKLADVPKYVELGTADCGIVGSDCISESQCDVYEPIELNFGKCKMVIAAKKNKKIEFNPGTELTVATKFPNITRKFFLQNKMVANIIYLNGSVELAPLVGLSDVIVDITETGETIKKNNLKIIKKITDITAKFIVNKNSYRIKEKIIKEFSNRLKK